MRAAQATLLFLVLAISIAAVPALAVSRVPGEHYTGAEGPDGVLLHLETAVKLRNFKEYRSVLPDSFVYIPDLASSLMYPEVDWANWDITMEETFLRQMLSPVNKSEMILTNRITERGMPYDGQARYELIYEILIGGRSYVGKARFIFIEVEDRWYLWKWEEIEAVVSKENGETLTNSGIVRASIGSKK